MNEKPMIPADIARLALKQLAYGKVPPTPDNFRKVYDDIAGTRSRNDEFSALSEVVESVLKDAGKKRPKYLNLPKAFRDAISEKRWKEVETTLRHLLPGADSNGLGALEPPGNSGGIAGLWRDLLVEALELGLLSRLAGTTRLEGKARALLKQAKQAGSEEQVINLGAAFKAYWKKLEKDINPQSKFHEALVALFRQLLKNMEELATGDQWLHEQIRVVRALVDESVDLATLRDAKSKLEKLLERQGLLKRSLQDAKLALKQMAACCIEMLSTIVVSSGEHHDRIRQYQEQISATEDLLELNAILDNLRQDMLHMRADALRTFEELKASHEKVLAADRLIDKLSLELDQVSELASRDFLTGILNRRGADEAMEREFSRAERTARPVCVALLDIDYFKSINDTYGHDTGDEAIRHLVDVARRALRPADMLSRYGGEEFLIILPETDLAEGEQILIRLQRELTRQLFLHDNQRVLITFSAGVTERMMGESSEAVVMRADHALYEAKHSGRNRVSSA